jgi:hypothetical protein
MKYRALILLWLLLLTLVAVAQKSTGPKYDPASETTLKGVVDDVKEVPNSFAGEAGVHVLLKTSDGIIEVLIAPVGFLKDMDITFAKGEELKIIGAKVNKDGNALVLAREITQNGNEFVVRDKQGVPVWSWMKKG